MSGSARMSGWHRPTVYASVIFLNNPVSWQLVGASKNYSYLPFLTEVFQHWWCATCRVIQLLNKTMTFLGGGSQHILTPYIFSGGGVKTPNPQDLRPDPSCRRSIVGRTAYESWSMRIVDDGSPAPTFWSFVLGHDSLSPMEQQRHWLEDTVCLELIRNKMVASSA